VFWGRKAGIPLPFIMVRPLPKRIAAFNGPASDRLDPARLNGDTSEILFEPIPPGDPP
jgi:hypothetical protein